AVPAGAGIEESLPRALPRRARSRRAGAERNPRAPGADLLGRRVAPSARDHDRARAERKIPAHQDRAHLRSRRAVQGGRVTDLASHRADFPLLKRTIDGQPIVFLDSASTTPKPQAVIDEVVAFYTHHTANVHRGVHMFGEDATQKYEEARAEVASFL